MMALEGGCRWIQLRMKDADEDEIEKSKDEDDFEYVSADDYYLDDEDAGLAHRS